jgi:predicted RNA-binding Zn ribbon-like protein
VANSPELGGRFQRAARTVGDCLVLVKQLSPEVNSARSFREKCSNLLGAAIAASLALQEVRGL